MNAPADPATVLLVEDDPNLARALAVALKSAGYRPILARNAAEGLRWFAHHAPDIVLLDLGLPDRDGLDVIKDLRRRGTTPIIVLSARSAEAMKVAALDLGADDYVAKPFGLDELLARMRTGLRHGVQARGSEPLVRTGDLVIDFGRRTVIRAGRATHLSPKEYDLLSVLALELGRTVPHARLLEAVWGSARTDVQYLRVYVGQLRRALEDPLEGGLIESEPGVGYRLAERPPA
jgi:two-component system, OmpR family, KDP operon response regulator KdpE